MASPADSTSGENAFGKPKAGLEQITFRFCSECSNMLYPKEDESAHKLQFTCRTCQYTEEATSMCIFRNVLNNAAGETAGVTQDVGQDPTVGIPSPVSAAIAESFPYAGNIDDCYCVHCGEFIMPIDGSSVEDTFVDTTSELADDDGGSDEMLVDSSEAFDSDGSMEWEDVILEGLTEPTDNDDSTEELAEKH